MAHPERSQRGFPRRRLLAAGAAFAGAAVSGTLAAAEADPSGNAPWLTEPGAPAGGSRSRTGSGRFDDPVDVGGTRLHRPVRRVENGVKHPRRVAVERGPPGRRERANVPRNRVLASLAICITLPATAGAVRVDDFIAREMRATHVPAMAVVVLRRGVVVHEKAYGTANLEFGVPARAHDVYPIASITKLFTAVATFLLVQDGKLRLDDEIASFLPDAPPSWKGITVLDCLAHTTGIPDFPQIFDSPSVPASQADALAAIESRPLAYASRTKSVYSQADFLLLKIAIERVSGLSFDEFLKTRIFVPTEITTARFGDSRDVFPRQMSVYTRAAPAADRFHSIPLRPFVNRADDVLSHSQLLFPAYTHASAGLNMTAADLSHLDSALRSGMLLEPKLLQRMWTPIHLADGSLGDFTAGWQRDEWSGHRVVGHIGAGMAAFIALPDDGYTLVLLTNVQETKIWDLGRRILQLYVPAVAQR